MSRKKLTLSERKSRVRQWRDDGDRLREALAALSLSQDEAAKRAALRQGQLNDVINGRRGVTLEEIRKLGRIGVSPEFVLGLAKTNHSPGETRSRTEIADDLGAAIALDISANFPLGTVDTPCTWGVDGNAAVSAAVSVAREQASRAVDDFKRLVDNRNVLRTLTESVERLNAGLSELPNHYRKQVVQLVDAAIALARQTAMGLKNVGLAERGDAGRIVYLERSTLVVVPTTVPIRD